MDNRSQAPNHLQYHQDNTSNWSSAAESLSTSQGATSPSKITRASARHISNPLANLISSPSTSLVSPPPPPPPPPPVSRSLPPGQAGSLRTATRKRKLSAQYSLIESENPSLEPALSRKKSRSSKSAEVVSTTLSLPSSTLPPPQAKARRQNRIAAAMPHSDAESGPNDEQTTSRRKTGRKKAGTDLEAFATGSAVHSTSRSVKQSSRRRAEEKTESSRRANQALEDSDVPQAEVETDSNTRHMSQHNEQSQTDEGSSQGWSSGVGSRLETAMQRIHGAITRTMTELMSILDNLKQRHDPTLQRIALEELAHVLLMANEDTLAGHFSPEPFIREIIPLMRGNDFGNEDPELMLMACRCLANMMEALPSSTGSIVYSGAVPILCQKLMEIHYIDLAEQSLSTLEKISVEFPSAIVREGGLTGCLMYLDFFATSTQRTAVTTAANCCRDIPDDSFATVVDVMPILLGVLSNSDQKVLEQGCLCISRIVESVRHQDTKLEKLVSDDLLEAILRLLIPGTTNLIGPKIHTSFLRVLAFTARASPRRSVALFKMNVIDTLFQILTGVSPPSGSDAGVSAQIDKVMVMQAFIHRPRDQIYEALNVICELLPDVTSQGLHYIDKLFDAGYPGPELLPLTSTLKKGESGDDSDGSDSSGSSDSNDRSKLLASECQAELRRFVIILLPTLTDVYSSTVNLSVRQKVLTAQLKMFSNIHVAILEEALKNVSYSSFLATILSQVDHPTLVTFALQASEVLLKRMEHIYRPQFYREGVFAEIASLASRSQKSANSTSNQHKPHEITKVSSVLSVDISIGSSVAESFMPEGGNANPPATTTNHDVLGDLEMEFHDGQDEADGEDSAEEAEESPENDDDGERDVLEEDHDHQEEHGQDTDDSEETSEEEYVGRHKHSSLLDPQDAITTRSKKFMSVHDSCDGHHLRVRATNVLQDLQKLMSDISHYYASKVTMDSFNHFYKLAQYFGQDALKSVTSYEILSSKMIETLLSVISETNPNASDSRAAFLKAFMGLGTQTKSITATPASSATPFSMLVHKLQDLLSREEHFEVMTVHHHSYDGSRNSSASILAKQIRIKLVAADDSVPEPFRQTVVTVHALATIKSLAEFLRPRISLPERTSRLRRALLPHVAYSPQQYVGTLVARSEGLSASSPALSAAGDLNCRTMPRRSERAERLHTAKFSGADPETNPTTLSPSGSDTKPTTGLRRSRRRQAQASAPPTPLLPPPPPPQVLASPDQESVECADDQPISDGETLSDREAFDRILHRLGDRLGHRFADPSPLSEVMDTEEDDTSAVNVEIAEGKLVAKKEDGTRIATPISLHKTTRPVSSPKPSGSGDRATLTPSRVFSYAAAMASTPQDWHLEFSVNDQPISPDTTLYRVVHFSQPQNSEISTRTLLSHAHTIKFKKVDGPPPTDTGSPAVSTTINYARDGALSVSLSHHPITASILQLLRLLHDLNSNLDDILTADKESSQHIAEPLSRFVNTKLTAKLNRQLEEPLIVASGCLPTWSEDLARLYPFLFPFETRHLFLQSTSFGFARSITRWQNDQSVDSRNGRLRDDRHHFLGRLQRQKVRISRNRMLESCVKVMDLYGHSPAILEVEFFNEVGTGLGPTLEFYSTVSKQFAMKSLRLWRENDSGDASEYAFGPRGLFPAPMPSALLETENGKRVLALFKTLGKFVARSMLDSRIIDVSFNPTFFRIGLASGTVTRSLSAMELVDESLARSLRSLQQAVRQKQKIEENVSLSDGMRAQALAEINVGGVFVEDLFLDFTLPGYPEFELKPRGASISVDLQNLEEYIDKVVDYTLGEGVYRQIQAFQEGFSQVFPYTALQAFTPDELVMLFGRVNEDWSLESMLRKVMNLSITDWMIALMDSIKADHGFNLDSQSVKDLLQIMSSFTLQERRDFLQFVTGSPKLPIGGFKSLTPMLTVVCKPSEAPYTSDDYLPSVMTCVNYLKLPKYSTADLMRQKLGTAIKEGQGAFHLS